jgi:hypothetical protein
MLSKGKRSPTLAFFFFMMLSFAGIARAYIDPGTGSYMLQIAIAFLVGALFSLKVFWKRIVAFLRGNSSKKKKDGDSAL